MNMATKSIVSTFGTLLGLGGLDHGFFETLHGNTPTNGLFIQSIGPANRFWPLGTEDAFTLIPNFLLTGILAMMVSLAIIVWSIGYIHRKNGPLVFILLCGCLFLVGGGVAQVALFILTWVVATRINRPLSWWQKVLAERIRRRLAQFWPVFLIIGSGLFLVALEIAIFGLVPGVSDPQAKQYICWTFLGVAVGAYLLTIVSGFA
jgi:hypothetical protein